jgi:putative ABC transport system ATP-binding protein
MEKLMLKNWLKQKNKSQLVPRENEALIELHGVVKKYTGTAGSVTALNGVDLQIGAGEFVVVLGKSGAGKTTLVNMITGIDRPTSGEIRVAGTAVHVLGENERAVWRGRNVGVVLQFFQLLPSLTVIQNIMLPMDLADRYPIPQQRKRAMYLLEQMEIAEHAHKLPSAVSGGQQQRVAIARALANDPPILFADEPTGNLDSSTAQSVFAVFLDLVRQGKTIVLVTHDQDLARQAQRSVLLADGEIVKSEVTGESSLAQSVL